MDGSPQVVRFDVTTLWHFDAAEWAPSTASKADVTPSLSRVCFALESRHCSAPLACPLSATTYAVQQIWSLLDLLVGACELRITRYFPSPAWIFIDPNASRTSVILMSAKPKLH